MNTDTKTPLPTNPMQFTLYASIQIFRHLHTLPTTTVAVATHMLNAGCSDPPGQNLAAVRELNATHSALRQVNVGELHARCADGHIVAPRHHAAVRLDRRERHVVGAHRVHLRR
jgi:hypothetical protein